MVYYGIVRLFFVLTGAVMFSGCERAVINRGYDVDIAKFNQVNVGQDTATDVFNRLGSPTVRSSVLHANGDYCWIYSAKQQTKFGFINPKTVRVINYVITFNSSDIVKSIDKNSYEKPVTLARDTMKSESGKTKGVLKETFGGMGKYLDMYDKK